jgi:hypothetical protein
VSEPDSQSTPPPNSGGEGVRVTSKPQTFLSPARLYGLLALMLVIAGAGYLVFKPRAMQMAADRAAGVVNGGAAPAPATDAARASSGAAQVRVAPRTATTAQAQVSTADFVLPSLDPDDVAAYINPGDPEPTAAEIIEALNHAGIRSGLGAFTPPGTSPPLHGLAVPEDFELPEGYVRHHQVTDEGEPLEPILMFSPDYELVDAAGRVISLPEDLVVPPEMAPPGMPIRPIEIPGPSE